MESRRRTILAGALAAGLGALWPGPVAAATVWRIGMLDGRPRGEQDSFAQRFVDAMRNLGYVEGRDIEYVHKTSDGRWETLGTQLAALAQELVRAKPDAIVCFSTVSTKAVQRATTTIPIVTNAGDPVRAGFAKSLVRPGGNITGVALATGEVYGKALEHLKSIIPGRWTLAIAHGDKTRDVRSLVAAVEEGARACGIPMREVSFVGMDAGQAARALASMRGQGIRVLSAWDPIAGLDDESYDLMMATKYGLATAPAGEEEVNRGALMSYSPDGAGTEERKAAQLVRILRGTPPGEIPFETPTSYRLVINLTTAKILGLTIRREILLLADRVIE